MVRIALDVIYRIETTILTFSRRAVLQAFSGEGYWSRDPTPEETWAMMMLSFNHGAKAIMSWTFPASSSLEQAHGAMAQVATVAPVSTFLLGTQPTPIKVKGHGLLDVAYWVVGTQVMVGWTM